MHTFDLSKMADLSTLGLIADKVLYIIEQYPVNNEIPTQKRSTFHIAESLMEQAVKGLNSINDLEVNRDTAMAVGTYQIIDNAWSTHCKVENSESSTKDVESLLKRIIGICERIAKTGKLTVKTDEDDILNFFSAISKFTSKEHRILLRQATKVEV